MEGRHILCLTWFVKSLMDDLMLTFSFVLITYSGSLIGLEEKSQKKVKSLTWLKVRQQQVEQEAKGAKMFVNYAAKSQCVCVQLIFCCPKINVNYAAKSQCMRLKVIFCCPKINVNYAAKSQCMRFKLISCCPKINVNYASKYQCMRVFNVTVI